MAQGLQITNPPRYSPRCRDEQCHPSYHRKRWPNRARLGSVRTMNKHMENHLRCWPSPTDKHEYQYLLSCGGSWYPLKRSHWDIRNQSNGSSRITSSYTRARRIDRGKQIRPEFIRRWKLQYLTWRSSHNDVRPNQTIRSCVIERNHQRLRGKRTESYFPKNPSGQRWNHKRKRNWSHYREHREIRIFWTQTLSSTMNRGKNHHCLHKYALAGAWTSKSDRVYEQHHLTCECRRYRPDLRNYKEAYAISPNWRTPWLDEWRIWIRHWLSQGKHTKRRHKESKPRKDRED